MNEFAINWLKGGEYAEITAPASTALKNKLLRLKEERPNEVSTSFAIEFRICIVVRIIDERKRNNVETWIKCRVDQVGVHGNLNRVTIHQSLNTFGLRCV